MHINILENNTEDDFYEFQVSDLGFKLPRNQGNNKQINKQNTTFNNRCYKCTNYTINIANGLELRT